MSVDLLPRWREAQLAEVAWLEPDRTPQVAVVVPLLDQGRPAVALTYDRLDDAVGLRAARDVVLAVTFPTLARGAEPVSATARLEVVPDPHGRTFRDRLLTQELAKHPPSRRRADSLLLQREHPWFLPRLIVRAVHVGASTSHPVRDALAAVATADGLVTTTVALDGSPGAPRLATALPDGCVAILRHGADDVPHLDRTWQQRWRGTVVDGVLHLERHEGRPPGSPPEGVWRRWRAEVAFERACRAGLEAADGAGLTRDGPGGWRAPI